MVDNVAGLSTCPSTGHFGRLQHFGMLEKAASVSDQENGGPIKLPIHAAWSLPVDLDSCFTLWKPRSQNKLLHQTDLRLWIGAGSPIGIDGTLFGVLVGFVTRGCGWKRLDQGFKRATNPLNVLVRGFGQIIGFVQIAWHVKKSAVAVKFILAATHKLTRNLIPIWLVMTEHPIAGVARLAVELR